jgi:hexokinase
MTALLNDTESMLLSHAYTNPATRISLVCGTGLNAAVQLPVSSVSPKKLGKRPKDWTDAAKEIVVNTEASMFGEGIFPICRADKELDRNSLYPGFQPLEQLIGGRYLGEICRLVMMGWVKDGCLFGGKIPSGLEKDYGFGTELMSSFEELEG